MNDRKASAGADRQRIGVIFTPDNANDGDFWRWCPPNATLLLTRTRPDPTWLEEPAVDVVGDPPIWIPTDQEVHDAVQSLVLTEPAVVTYACTSGSFCGPDGNEARIRDVMARAGAVRSQTTSGALLDALRAIGASSVAVGTPYYGNVTQALGVFLERTGFEVASLVHEEPGPGQGEAHLSDEEVIELATRADRPGADVVFLSCTTLETYDLIPLLEASLSKPVLTATQVTMWAALGAVGAGVSDGGQSLLAHPWEPVSS